MPTALNDEKWIFIEKSGRVDYNVAEQMFLASVCPVAADEGASLQVWN
jgi:hypothetical protein